MAFTADQLAVLEQAASQGALTVKLADRLITYQSLDHLLRAVQLARQDVLAAAGAGRPQRRFLEHDRG